MTIFGINLSVFLKLFKEITKQVTLENHNHLKPKIVAFLL